MPRFVASAPSYVLALLVLSVVGAAASLYFVRLYLPMSVQEHYLGRAVVYTYSISPAEGAVYVRLFNPKSYRAKVDVLLVKSDGSVLTSCRGYVAGSRVVNGSVSLMGIVVEPLEEVTVACFESGVRDVRVFDYGLGSPGTERVREGVLPGQATPVDHPIDIEPPWLPVRFRYRLPITVVTTTHRKSLCVAVFRCLSVSSGALGGAQSLPGRLRGAEGRPRRSGGGSARAGRVKKGVWVDRLPSALLSGPRQRFEDLVHGPEDVLGHHLHGRQDQRGRLLRVPEDQPAVPPEDRQPLVAEHDDGVVRALYYHAPPPVLMCCTLGIYKLNTLSCWVGGDVRIG